MIVKISGILENITPLSAVVNVQGLSYEVKISLNVSETLKHKLDQNVELFVRHIFSETNQMLYGFQDQTERALFDFLRSLSGLGPGISINIVSTLGKDNLLQILRNGDEKALVKVPGIGKTKAEKIIFEAKQKKKKLQTILEEKTSTKENHFDEIEFTVHDALGQLGFQSKEIAAAKKKITSEEMPPQEKDYLQEWIQLYLSKI